MQPLSATNSDCLLGRRCFVTKFILHIIRIRLAIQSIHTELDTRIACSSFDW